ncbi:purine nucleoside phosphorylase II [Legionella adelaidensis]|uniref:Uridine phosphorylase n=2 Tax=Legionella adelaidensis TaxID=45056 RepID=A0A0W0R557_9GAMM|nr:purine nucleoside phosphorylase II [Legionella adelaidensis]
MIAAAELPLNRRGAVYHLDLSPDEIGDIIITVGDPGRVQEVSQHFDYVEVARSHREFVTHTGYLGKKRISVISTGIGVPNIDIVINELDALVNVDLVTRTPKAVTKSLTLIRLGTAGGLQPDCIPGDILITRFGVGFDTLMQHYPYVSSVEEMETALHHHLQGEGGDFYIAEADSQLINHFAPLGTVGITATCIGFFAPQGRKLRLPLKYPHFLQKLTTFSYDNTLVTNLEMETAAILALGRLLGHKCLSLSVALNNRVKKNFVEDVKSTVEGLIQKAFEKILLL